IVPALLYFLTAFVMVHLEAGRSGLHGLPKDQCPNAIGALRSRWFLLLPLFALVFLLFSGYTPLFSGTVGLALTALIVLGVPIGARIHDAAGSTALAGLARTAFWVALGLFSVVAFRGGITIAGRTVAGITLMLVPITLLIGLN